MKFAAAALGAAVVTVGLWAHASLQAEGRKVSLQSLPYVSSSLQLPRKSVGMGVFVSEAGNVLTGYHVVRSCRQIWIARRGERPLRAALGSFDSSNDLALLATGLSGATPAPIRVASRASVPEGALFVGMNGSSGGIPEKFPLHAARVAANSGPQNDTRLFALVSGWSGEDPRVQPGDSGGPVFDRGGNLLGIVAGISASRSPVKDSILNRTSFVLDAGLIAMFLDAQGIAVKAAPDSAKLAEIATLAKQAEDVTVRIWCLRDKD